MRAVVLMNEKVFVLRTRFQAQARIVKGWALTDRLGSFGKDRE
jgi:hypothetical protein